jgi:3-methyladenine DNA glycosylase AlkD
VGSLNGRISKLEGLASTAAADAEDDRRLRIARAITRMILEEFNRLKVSSESERFAGDLLERAVRGVVEEQYSDLDQESRRYIADGWIETIHSWTRLDWMVNAGRGGPPSA